MPISHGTQHQPAHVVTSAGDTRGGPREGGGGDTVALSTVSRRLYDMMDLKLSDGLYLDLGAPIAPRPPDATVLARGGKRYPPTTKSVVVPALSQGDDDACDTSATVNEMTLSPVTTSHAPSPPPAGLAGVLFDETFFRMTIVMNERVAHRTLEALLPMFVGHYRSVVSAAVSTAAAATTTSSSCQLRSSNARLPHAAIASSPVLGLSSFRPMALQQGVASKTSSPPSQSVSLSALSYPRECWSTPTPPSSAASFERRPPLSTSSPLPSTSHPTRTLHVPSSSSQPVQRAPRSPTRSSPNTSHHRSSPVRSSETQHATQTSSSSAAFNGETISWEPQGSPRQGGVGSSSLPTSTSSSQQQQHRNDGMIVHEMIDSRSLVPVQFPDDHTLHQALWDAQYRMAVTQILAIENRRVCVEHEALVREYILFEYNTLVPLLALEAKAVNDLLRGIVEAEHVERACAVKQLAILRQEEATRLEIEGRCWSCTLPHTFEESHEPRTVTMDRSPSAETPTSSPGSAWAAHQCPCLAIDTSVRMMSGIPLEADPKLSCVLVAVVVTQRDVLEELLLDEYLSTANAAYDVLCLTVEMEAASNEVYEREFLHRHRLEQYAEYNHRRMEFETQCRVALLDHLRSVRRDVTDAVRNEEETSTAVGAEVEAAGVTRVVHEPLKDKDMVHTEDGAQGVFDAAVIPTHEGEKVVDDFIMDVLIFQLVKQHPLPPHIAALQAQRLAPLTFPQYQRLMSLQYTETVTRRFLWEREHWEDLISDWVRTEEASRLPILVQEQNQRCQLLMLQCGIAESNVSPLSIPHPLDEGETRTSGGEATRTTTPTNILVQGEHHSWSHPIRQSIAAQEDEARHALLLDAQDGFDKCSISDAHRETLRLGWLANALISTAPLVAIDPHTGRRRVFGPHGSPRGSPYSHATDSHNGSPPNLSFEITTSSHQQQHHQDHSSSSSPSQVMIRGAADVRSVAPLVLWEQQRRNQMSLFEMQCFVRLESLARSVLQAVQHQQSDDLLSLSMTTRFRLTNQLAAIAHTHDVQVLERLEVASRGKIVVSERLFQDRIDRVGDTLGQLYSRWRSCCHEEACARQALALAAQHNEGRIHIEREAQQDGALFGLRLCQPRRWVVMLASVPTTSHIDGDGYDADPKTSSTTKTTHRTDRCQQSIGKQVSSLRDDDDGRSFVQGMLVDFVSGGFCSISDARRLLMAS